MNYNLDALISLKTAFEQGNIGREQYWKSMGDYHTGLIGYSRLLKNSVIKKIEIEESGLFIVLENGIEIGWNPSDTRQVATTLVNHGEYEKFEGGILNLIAEDAETILDIGANCGWYSMHLKKGQKKGGKTKLSFTT